MEKSNPTTAEKPSKSNNIMKVHLGGSRGSLEERNVIAMESIAAHLETISKALVKTSGSKPDNAGTHTDSK
jgi:methyl coenzyme M reductase gamma subunit